MKVYLCLALHFFFSPFTLTFRMAVRSYFAQSEEFWYRNERWSDLKHPEPWQLFFLFDGHDTIMTCSAGGRLTYPKNYSGRKINKKSMQVCDAAVLHLKRTACYLLMKNADETEALGYLLWMITSMFAPVLCASTHLCDALWRLVKYVASLFLFKKNMPYD